MEVAPRYWQSPQTLKDVYVSTSGGPQRHATTNAAAGTGRPNRASADAGAATAAPASPAAARNAATNALANTGKGSASTGAAVSTSLETMVPLAAVSHYGPATRRWRSITRDRSSPRRSRSTWRRAIAQRRGHEIDQRCADRHAGERSTAASPAPRRPSSNRSPTSRS
jgi:hypothetical protein